jgi:transglutaminase-like putative cysteine protease
MLPKTEDGLLPAHHPLTKRVRANFAADLALHDLRILYWPRIEDDYYEDVGEYSYDTARAKIDEIIILLDIGTYDTSVDIIEKVLTFINSYIHYESEANDVFHAPVETLGFKSGDCDDFTILAAALFEDLGIESAIRFYYNEDIGYHAMVLVHLENLGDYGYWYFSDLTHRGLEEGRWITIEPQLTIEYQDSDWIEQWDLLVASPLDFEP